MLREFRRSDSGTFLRFLRQYFPDEEMVLGSNPEELLKIIRRVFRWDLRIVLRLARLVGRPIVRFYVLEVDGVVAGTTILTFTRRAGYLSAVVVDAPFRRRGLAHRLIERAHQDARGSGRSFAVLDVVSHNAPALALYASTGYLPLRHLSVMFRDLDPGDRVATGVRPAGLRPFRRGDGEALSRRAGSVLPPKVAEVLPAEAASFRLSSTIARLLDSTSEAWVLDDGDGPVAFVRATVSRAMSGGHLTAPLIAGTLEEERANSFVQYALHWVAEQGARRVIVEIPSYDVRAMASVQGNGFRTAYEVDTLYLPLHA